MRGTNNLQKIIFLARFKIAIFKFCKVRACRIPVKNSLMRGTNNLQKNIFLALFKIAQKFHYFCKVRACRISVKNSILQKLPKIVEKHFF